MFLVSFNDRVDMNNHFQKQHTKTSEYILSTGKYGSGTLDLQHDIFKDEAFLQLQKAGLKKGIIVWDIGCGNGIMTLYLAKTVGINGKIYAIDSSEEQIKIAKKRADASGCKNVTFIVGDINTIDSRQYDAADIVYARFLLMHVHNPQKVIALMSSLLKSGGVLASQESSMFLDNEENVNPIIKKYYNLLIEYGIINGFDYNIGVRLPKMYGELGTFKKVISYTKNYPTTVSIKKLLYLRIDEFQQKLVKSKISTAEEYAKLKQGLRSFFKREESNESLVMCKQAYILGYKK